MRNILVIICLMMLLSGCATTEYFTNPNSAGYNEAAFGGLCQNCNRVFYFSRNQYDNCESVSCCYCGCTQNLKMAASRYAYEVKQQQARNTQQAVTEFNQNLKDIYEKNAAAKQKNIENFQNNINRPGSWSNPVHVKIGE